MLRAKKMIAPSAKPFVNFSRFKRMRSLMRFPFF